MPLRLKKEHNSHYSIKKEQREEEEETNEFSTSREEKERRIVDAIKPQSVRINDTISGSFVEDSNL